MKAKSAAVKQKKQVMKAISNKPASKPVMKKAKNQSDEDGAEIIGLILQDHKPLKALILTLKDPDVTFSKKKLAFEKFAPALTVHAKSEEESLYVQMKKFKKLRTDGFEGDIEHTIADHLVQDLKQLTGHDEDRWMAKVKVLAELVEHHIKEEESEMFKEVRKEFDEAIRMQIGKDYIRLVNFHQTQLNSKLNPKQTTEKVPNDQESTEQDSRQPKPQGAVWSANEKIEKHKNFYR